MSSPFWEYMNIKNLKLLGITDNELEVYLILLKNGKLTATKIRQKTGITNSRVYAAIDNLISNGIITYEKRPQGKIYSALSPDALKEIIEKRSRKIEECIPFLNNIYKKDIVNTETAVFEGYKGFKNALINLANECPRNETIYIIGFSNQDYKNDKLAMALIEANKISVEKNHKFKMILDNKENKFYEQRKKEKISDIRFVGKNFKSPASIDIFLDRVYILMWDETPYAFTIKNNKVAEGFKTYFDFLWNMAKP